MYDIPSPIFLQVQIQISCTEILYSEIGSRQDYT